MAFTEDISAFFSTDGFAVDATLSGVGVRGIFDASYTDAFGNVVEGYAPVFMLATSDCASVAHGDVLVVQAHTYKVRGVEPDGTGVTLLRLERQ
jgi:phage head-tail attachment protein